MDLSKLIKKPDIHYTPERVDLPPPAEPLPETLAAPAYSNVEDDVADVRSALEAEIANVSDLMNAVLAALPSIEVEVPPEQSDLISQPRITMSDYLNSLGDEDYGPVAIRDVFEEHISVNEPAALSVPLIDDLKRSLQSDLDSLSDSMFSGNFGLESGANNDKALYNIRCSIADSQDLREEISRAAWAAKVAIDQATWAHIISASSREKFNTNTARMITDLQRLRSLLRVTSTLFALDWKSAMSNIRDFLKSALVDQYLSKMFSAYNRAYNKIAEPVSDIMTALSSPDLHDMPEADYLKNLLGTPIKHLQDQNDQALADIYAIRRKRTALRINGARAVGTLSYTSRLTAQLDAIIAGLQTLSTGSKMSLEAPAPQGALGKILDDKKVYQVSPDAPPIMFGEEVSKQVDQAIVRLSNPQVINQQ